MENCLAYILCRGMKICQIAGLKTIICNVYNIKLEFGAANMLVLPQVDKVVAALWIILFGRVLSARE